jgi:hypothetical protein
MRGGGSNDFLLVYSLVANRKVAGSNPDKVTQLLFFNLPNTVLLAARGAGVYSTSNRNQYQKQENNVCREWSAAGEQG